MGVKLKKGTLKEVSCLEMEDGDIAVILSWPKFFDNYSPVGKIIQRFGSKLVVLGEGVGKHYPEIPKSKECLVRILTPGTLIEIT